MGDVRNKVKEKSHRCTFTGCTAAFFRRDRWSQHMLSHSNIKQYACHEDGCSKAYTSRSHLERHINSAHRKYQEDVFSCTICFKEFANRQNLKRHLKTHEGSKPMRCDMCNMEFKKKHLLSSHLYQHTGVKPFSCEFCSKQCVTLREKKRHMRCHKKYECSEPDCNQKFNHWSLLQKHLATDHEGREFICDTCGRIFKHRIHIIRHLKLHDKIRQKYECPYKNCKRSYSRNSNLKQHLRMKHEKLVHECSVCKAQLSTKVKLKEHIIKIHGSERKKRIPKTRATGRKLRKDIGSMKVTSALKLAILPPEKPNNPETVMVITAA